MNTCDFELTRMRSEEIHLIQFAEIPKAAADASDVAESCLQVTVA